MEHFDTLYTKSKDFIETTLAIYKLQTIDFLADAVSGIISRVLIIFVLAIFLIFFNVGVSLYLADLFGSYYKGFFIVALFYLLITVLLLIVRRRIVKSALIDLIIVKLKDYKPLNATDEDIQ